MGVNQEAGQVSGSWALESSKSLILKHVLL